LAYLAVKEVKGRYYGYLQESYREGGSVRTRTVEYLGAIEPAVAKQVQTTKKKLGEVDRAAVVQSARNATATITKAPKKPTEPVKRYERRKVNGRFEVVDMKTGEIIEQKDPQVITTQKEPKPLRSFSQALKMPNDLHRHKVSMAAINGTYEWFGARLKNHKINPSTMPDVVIKYRHPDSLKRNRKSQYVITTSRNPDRQHTINKTRLWNHYRQALSSATFDTIEQQDPELFLRLQSELSQHHQEGKRLLMEHYANATTGTARLGLSLQLYFWGKIPKPRRKSDYETAAFDLAQISPETVNDWQAEGALMLAEAHKNGWQGLREKTVKSERKHKAQITKKLNEINRLSRFDIIAGKRRKLLREIMATEAKLKAVQQLQARSQKLRELLGE